MKLLPLLLCCCIPFCAVGQTQPPAFDPEKWEPPYSLGFPPDWTVERFLIPISFAPQIPYKGVEDIRFAPGWGKSQSDEYWSYAFLWYIDGKPSVTAESIAQNLKLYYNGLVLAMQGDIPDDKLTPVKTVIKKVKTEKGDVKTFRGSIYMTDYMAKKPIALYCRVHLKTCAKQDKTYIFYEISPQPYQEKVWQGLHLLWTDFKCTKDVRIPKP
jgi:hypothetical protein